VSEYSAPVGAPVWFDLISSDTATAADFYGRIFGWEVEEPNAEFGGYRNFTRNGRRIAGLMPHVAEHGDTANIWSVYLHTADAAATRADAEAAGATVLVPPMPVGDMGTMMVVLDPAGASIGFWQPGTHPGFTTWGEHGTPYWFECQSKDYGASVAFYEKVIGARAQEVGTGGAPDVIGPDRYAQVFVGDSSYSGIMDAATVFPAEVPSFWQVYVMVDDIAATVAHARELGAEILMPGEETPYGTLAALRDPLGALICLGHPPAGS